ncbi:MAG: hypothetical protein C6Y22_26480 [Hapalosiphonaceae cyanobacterium JJU2]|nr:MAG: hypothetical protein C6Y22_26480 [Hapalosiphonaceae cyanobacterium JJU2]
MGFLNWDNTPYNHLIFTHMSNQPNIIYPTLNLLLYDLKNGLGDDEATINNRCKAFCEKIFGDLKAKEFDEAYKQIQKYQYQETDGIDLLANRFRIFTSPKDGYYYPRQFGDTYALLVDYSGKLNADAKPDDQPQEIKDQPFYKLKAEIQTRISQKHNQTQTADDDYEAGTIGQTWLAWGKLTEKKSDVEITEIAKQCYTQIATKYHKWDIDLIEQGNLFGGTLFELWYIPEIAGLTGKEFWEKFRKESHHVLIWLFPADISADDMRDQVKTVYQDLLRLFQYRHKVVWGYYQSLYQKAKLKTEFIQVQASINAARELETQLKTNQLNLTSLQKTLTETLVTLSDYTIELNYLDDQIRSIKTNLENYKYRLAEINRKYPGSDLKFLQQFSESEIYGIKYLRQAETDYANLNPGLNVLQNLSNTLQSITQLEQTKSDRKLDNTIALVGVGLAISSVTVTVATAYLPKPKDYSNYDLSILISPAFVFSVAFSVGCTILGYKAIRRFRR